MASTPISVNAPRHDKWLVTVAISLGTLMGAIDSSIVNIALPQIRGSLGATLEESTWAVASFIIALVIMLPLTGLLCRWVGEKRAYLGSLTLFIVASIACGLAWNLESLVIFRALQGLGAGALTPIEQTVLRRIFPPEEQGMAMAVFTMVIVLGPTLGPTLGGWIVERAAWPWIFWINGPIGVLAWFMVWRFVDDPPAEEASAHAVADATEALGASGRPSVDWLGLGLLAVGVATLQAVLESGHRELWLESTRIRWLSAVALVAFVGLAVRLRSARAPLVALSLFRDRLYAAGLVVGVLVFGVILANLFLLSLFMQELLGMTAMQAGLTLAPRTLVMALTMPLVGWAYARCSPRLLIGAGLVISYFGFDAVAGIAPDTGWRDLLPGLLLQGVGASLVFVPLNTVLFETVPQRRMADAASLNLMARHLGSALSLAFVASLLPRFAAQARVGLVPHAVPGRGEVVAWVESARAALVARGLDPATAEAAAVRLLGDAVETQATFIAYDRLFSLLAVALLAGIPLLALLAPRRPAPLRLATATS